MRSLLLQFQTPTVPRRVSRFFRVWLLSGLPRLADHPAYFGLAKFYFRLPFQPSTEANLNSCFSDVNASIFAAISNIYGCCCGKQGDSRNHSNSMGRNQFHVLTPGNTSRIVVPANIGCRISLPTWMAAHWEILVPRVLEW